MIRFSAELTDPMVKPSLCTAGFNQSTAAVRLIARPRLVPSASVGVRAKLGHFEGHRRASLWAHVPTRRRGGSESFGGISLFLTTMWMHRF